MSEENEQVLVLLGELESLSDAHLIGTALEEAGIAFRVAEQQSHAFDLAMPHGWGMLYADAERLDEARRVVESVRGDEAMLEEGELVGEEEPEGAPGS